MKKFFSFRFWKFRFGRSLKRKYPNWSLSRAVFGFTLIELLVVMSIVAVLAAIAGPSWLGTLNRQRLGESQNQVYRAIKTAQANAKRDKMLWQTSFRDSPIDGKTAQIAVHKAFPSGYTATAADINGLPWESVVSNVVINTDVNFTTAQKVTSPTTYYYLRFDAKGQANELGRVTLSYGDQSGARACVIVSTLIGAVRTDSDTNCNKLVVP
ncbi:type II secretion system protein [Tumidithrix elongata RA019]|uniref:Type II secretion system protein n=1 Tax=Tumidithrix elongata BACA0141 TaxID=2716417 RepID=A0AAW9PVE3_9CYAN|nr:type II secretion system protein [Tumidithrix elongata RA019]